ncbi:MAG: Hpt domain-containing protein, partial [Eubacterium sp.]|nr:Hpt domain-containing protein [Eubacterium sp.]
YGIDVDSALEYCQGDEELYKDVLRDYVEDAQKSVQILNEALENNDMESYEIKVHAIKGTSKMIGADEIYETALELEMLAKEKKAQEMDVKHEALTEKIAFITGAIKSILK